MRRIILVGYMGSGKTTIGRALSREVGLFFYDLDWYIKERYHKSVPEIFAQMGEDGFRDLERRMLHEVAEFENVIISAGGGTPCFFDNMAYMNQQADTVYLKASPDVLYGHLSVAKVERPLIKDKSPEEMIDYIRTSLNTREPFYSQAKYTLNVNNLENYENIKESVRLIRQLINL